MRVRFENGSREIEIIGGSHPVKFYSQEMAVAYFRRLLQDDPANGAALRRALATDLPAEGLFRMGDEEVLKELGRRVVYGDLQIVASNTFPSGNNATPAGESPSSTPREDEQAARQQSQAAAAAPASARQEAAPSEEEEETDPVVACTDAEAQAQTLQAAAESGAPLCEL